MVAASVVLGAGRDPRRVGDARSSRCLPRGVQRGGMIMGRRVVSECALDRGMLIPARLDAWPRGVAPAVQANAAWSVLLRTCRTGQNRRKPPPSRAQGQCVRCQLVRVLVRTPERDIPLTNQTLQGMCSKCGVEPVRRCLRTAG